MMNEEKNCSNCRYFFRSHTQEPCHHCKRNYDDEWTETEGYTDVQVLINGMPEFSGRVLTTALERIMSRLEELK